MRIVLFGHPRVGMTKLFGDNTHRNAAHGEDQAIGLAEHVERDFWLDIIRQASRMAAIGAHLGPDRRPNLSVA